MQSHRISQEGIRTVANRNQIGALEGWNRDTGADTRLTPLLDVLGAADRSIVLEVTENFEIGDYPRLMAALNQVRPMPCWRWTMPGPATRGCDKFVKLDISLIRNVDTDPARQAMVAGMARFAESVGCALIAEGIETENELTAVRLVQVGYGQGYHLARPATIGAIVDSLAGPIQVAPWIGKPMRRSRAA